MASIEKAVAERCTCGDAAKEQGSSGVDVLGGVILVSGCFCMQLGLPDRLKVCPNTIASACGHLVVVC